MKKRIFIFISILLVFGVGAHYAWRAWLPEPSDGFWAIESLAVKKAFSEETGERAIQKFERFYEASVSEVSALKITDRVTAVRTASELEATLRAHELVMVRLKLLGNQGDFFDNFLSGIRQKIESVTKVRIEFENELTILSQDELAGLSRSEFELVKEQMISIESNVAKLRAERSAQAVGMAQGLLEQAVGKINDGQNKLSGGEYLQAFLAFEEARRFLLETTIVIATQKKLGLNFD